MSTTRKPAWRILFIIGLVSAAALYLEPRLPVDSQAHTWLLLAWMVLFYGGVAAWTRNNSEALEQEPPALDCAGRPVIDDGTSVPPRQVTAAQTRNRHYQPDAESRYLGYRHSEANRSV